MRLTPRQLNRATLNRQMLLERESLAVADAVRRVVALQAQEAPSPYLALWNRLTDFEPEELDAAFADREVVKASLMRITLHAVHAEDYPGFHNAMRRNLRAARLGDSRFTSSGLSIADADALLPHLAEFVARPRTGAEIEDFLTARFGEPKRGLWWALRTFAPLHHAPTGGPWSFGVRPSFVAAWTTSGPEFEDESVRRLVLRYLRAFGPASVPDLAQFTMLRRPVLLQAVRALAGKVEEVEGPDGATLFDVPGAPLPAEDTAAPPRLLPMWDSVLLAYSDRSRIIPPEYRSLVIRRNGDVLPTLLVDGYVAGVWRPVQGGIEATAFHRLDEEAWKGLAAEAGALAAFLADRGTTVYRRYDHWWTKQMPSAEVRLLPK
ncbi:winged helix DNA-binding domain-containing protein [Streptosporangium sp. OZ121]|uniref:winged helix DNA-binding domain-containing protein n=1 Tax=Streptosporangium sp. OZ121 TaxID=3444183 RepID=UPI003F78B4B7